MFLHLFTLSNIPIIFLSPYTHPILKPGNNILEKLPMYITPLLSLSKDAKGIVGELSYKSSSLKPSSIIGIPAFFKIL